MALDYLAHTKHLPPQVIGRASVESSAGMSFNPPRAVPVWDGCREQQGLAMMVVFADNGLPWRRYVVGLPRPQHQREMLTWKPPTI